MPVPPSFIKNIALQLRSNYEFDNSPIEMDNDHENAATRFIGRKEQKEKLLKFLGNNSKKGVFFVNHTISLKPVDGLLWMAREQCP